MKVSFLCNRFDSSRQRTFQAHQDFHILAKEYEIKASSYFRRGGFYGSPSEEFADIIRTMKNVFRINDCNKKNMFIGGIGDSQEPFSLLAVIKCLIKEKPLKDAVDLDIVDLQSRPKDKKLFEQSYFDCGYAPEYVKDSFIKDDGEKYGLRSYKQYRVKDEIFDFLKQTYHDSKKSHWNSRIQEVVETLDDQKYDIVSVNNTLGYITDENTIFKTLNHIKRIIKKDGIFITDPYSKFNETLKDSMDEAYKGIFVKG